MTDFHKMKCKKNYKNYPDLRNNLILIKRMSDEGCNVIFVIDSAGTGVFLKQ